MTPSTIFNVLFESLDGFEATAATEALGAAGATGGLEETGAAG